MKQRWLLAGTSLVIWAGLVAARAHFESVHLIVSNFKKHAVGTSWDPRGFENLDAITRTRESESFKDRLKRGNSIVFAWPGLRALQVSWTWLELLQGLHNEASYEGDFSWMFSKLHVVISNSPKAETHFVTGLAPFFMVMGKDIVGASILVQEMINRAPDYYNTWFWSGWFAMEQLGDFRIASYFFRKSSEFPNAPHYLETLWRRLSLGYKLSDAELANIVKEEIKGEDSQVLRDFLEAKSKKLNSD